MTDQRDLKKLVRARMAQTGEAYTTAKAAVVLGADTAVADYAQPIQLPLPTEPVEAVILKVANTAARIHIPGEAGQINFRTTDLHRLVPGHVATLRLTKRWHARHDNAVGSVLGTRIDLAAWGLPPLPLTENGLEDFTGYEPWAEGDPCFDVLSRATSRPRIAYEMDPIAWDAVAARTGDYDDVPTIEAVELREAGDPTAARRLLMQVLLTDLRCIDAHVGLGNMAFDHSPDRAFEHYEIARRIGELSIGDGFDGVLLWGDMNNRPFLRALFGLGLVAWRRERFDEATALFERILMLNPPDNQGARGCLMDVRAGERWIPEPKVQRPPRSALSAPT